MITNESFKERVRKVAISCAKEYKRIFVDYEYLLCSSAFHQNDYYIISASKSNYKHLVGINSKLSPDEFFDKCYDGTLQLSEFDFCKKNQKEKEVKGSVRQKIQVLPMMLGLFTVTVYAEENFKKNKIECAFATEGNTFTVGYVLAGKPKTLLKGNELNKAKAFPVELILRKSKDDDKYREVIQGGDEEVGKYIDKIEKLVELRL